MGRVVFHCVGARQPWKPASHQGGVAVGGGVTRMPCSFPPLPPAALSATPERGKAVQLLPTLAHLRSPVSTEGRGKLVRRMGLHKLLQHLTAESSCRDGHFSAHQLHRGGPSKNKSPFFLALPLFLVTVLSQTRLVHIVPAARTRCVLGAVVPPA